MTPVHAVEHPDRGDAASPSRRARRPSRTSGTRSVPPSSSGGHFPAVGTSLASGEDHQRARLAVLLGEQRDQRAVRRVGSGRRAARPGRAAGALLPGLQAGGLAAGRGRGEAGAVGQAAGLVGGQVPAREAGRGRLGQRDAPRTVPASCSRVRATSRPYPPTRVRRSAGQVAAGAERGAEVAGQGADVGAARAADGRVDVELVAGRAGGGDGELVDGDRPGGQLRRGARPGQLVGALAADLDRADRRAAPGRCRRSGPATAAVQGLPRRRRRPTRSPVTSPSASSVLVDWPSRIVAS